MSLIWNECRLIYSKQDSFQVPVDVALKNKVKNHIKEYGKNNVWEDIRDGTLFSTSQNSWAGSSGKERSFLCPPNRFLTDENHFCTDCGGKVFCDRTLGHVLGQDVIADSEYLIQDEDVFKRVKDKTVMIVGGGPSTAQINWEQYHFDCLWSCNHFFLNDKMKDKTVDLWVPSDEVDLLGDNRLHWYLSEHDQSWCCFYPTVKIKPDYVRKAQKKIPNITYAHLRYRSKIGIMPRLLLLAIFCGAKNIMFVGMDGLPSTKLIHAFQPGKRPKGTSAKKGAINIFRRQYVQLWDYILFTLKADVELFNLGENVASNLSADISRQHFPLSRIS